MISDKETYPSVTKSGTRTLQIDAELDKLENFLGRIHEASEVLHKRLDRVCRSHVNPIKDMPQGETPYVQLAEKLNGLVTSASQTLQTLEIIIDTLEI